MNASATRLLALGCVIAACGGSDATGPKVVTLFACETGTTYSIGHTVEGTLGAEDCQARGGPNPADYYQFRVRSRATITISVASTEESVPLVLSVFNSVPSQVDIDFVPVGSSGAVSLPLDPGVYSIIVEAYEEGTASYTLSSSAHR